MGVRYTFVDFGAKNRLKNKRERTPASPGPTKRVSAGRLEAYSDTPRSSVAHPCVRRFGQFSRIGHILGGGGHFCGRVAQLATRQGLLDVAAQILALAWMSD